VRAGLVSRRAWLLSPVADRHASADEVQFGPSDISSPLPRREEIDSPRVYVFGHDGIFIG